MTTLFGEIADALRACKCHGVDLLTRVMLGDADLPSATPKGDPEFGLTARADETRPALVACGEMTTWRKPPPAERAGPLWRSCPRMGDESGDFGAQAWNPDATKHVAMRA